MQNRIVTLKEFLIAASYGGEGNLALINLYIEQNNNRYIEQNGESVLAINAVNEYGTTALTLAVIRGDLAIVTALLAQDDIAINAANVYGNTALIMAAAQGETAIVSALLTKDGIEVNAANEHDDTALGWAARGGHTAIVRDHLLPRLTLGEIMKQNRWHRTAAQEAAHHGRHHIAALITARETALRANTPQARLNAIKFAGDVPSLLICPITGHVMFHPITVSSGQTFERENLKTYFATHNNPETLPCPITRRPIHKFESDYQPSQAVKEMIENFVKEQEEHHKQSMIQDVMETLVQQVESIANQSHSSHESKQDQDEVRPADEQYEDILLPPSSPASPDEARQQQDAELEKLLATKKLAEDFLRSFEATFNRDPARDNQAASSSSIPENVLARDRMQIANKRVAFFAARKQESSSQGMVAASVNLGGPSVN